MPSKISHTRVLKTIYLGVLRAGTMCNVYPYTCDFLGMEANESARPFFGFYGCS